MLNVSGIVLTKNEEKNIVDCLESLSFCDEIIVVDDNSSDRTVEIIKNSMKENSKIKLFKRELNLNFSRQRRFGINKAKNDWILFLDADERIDEKLQEEIEVNLTEDIKFAGFLIPRIDFLWGKKLKHGETGNIKLLRLFDKRKGELKGKVHESWITDNSVGRLNYAIYHYPHPTISEFLREINFYTDLRADELFRQGKKTNAIYIIFYPTGKFILNYFIKLGILDGIEGLIHATLMSFHSFLVRGKLWDLWQKR